MDYFPLEKGGFHSNFEVGDGNLVISHFIFLPKQNSCEHFYQLWFKFNFRPSYFLLIKDSKNYRGVLVTLSGEITHFLTGLVFSIMKINESFTKSSPQNRCSCYFHLLIFFFYIHSSLLRQNKKLLRWLFSLAN